MSATARDYAPIVPADPQVTATVTEAINFILAAKDCPSEFRPLIDYLVGASGGTTDWFEAADEEVGYAARPSAGPVSSDAARKYIQRKRKGFLAWEKGAGVAFIECMPGGKDPASGKNFKSKYRVNLLRLTEETVRDAQGMSLWGRDERRAIELTAGEKAEETAGTRAHKPRFRAPRRDDDALLQRNPKTALTLLTETFKIKQGRGETDVDAFVDGFADELRERLKSAPPCAPPEVSTLDTEESGQTRGGTGGQRKPSRASCRACGASWEIGTGLHVCPPVGENPPKSQEIRVDTVVHPPAEAEALAAVELFESVGAVEFGVTVKNETDGGCDYEEMPGDGLREFLPPLLKRNARLRESVIVRAKAESADLWQIDDASQETVDLLRDMAFAVIETSPGSFQIWLAVADEEEKKVLDKHRARLLASVKATGGNGGSFGAVRWPGTFNQKHEPPPLVRVVEANRGRTTTVAELDALGLLAPQPEEKPRPRSNVVHIGGANRPWPSYDKALQKADGDRSDADFNWCLLSFLRDKGYAEVRARLLEVSESAREKTKHYIDRTLDRAEKAART